MKKRNITKWMGKMLSLTLALELVVPQNTFAFTDDDSSNNITEYVYEESSPENEEYQDIPELEPVTEEIPELEPVTEEVPESEPVTEEAEEFDPMEENGDAPEENRQFSEIPLDPDNTGEPVNFESQEENDEVIFGDGAEETGDSVSEELFSSEPTVIYDAADFTAFQNRTIEEVAAKYSAASLAGPTYLDKDQVYLV